MPSKPVPIPHIGKYICPYQCGWKREWSENAKGMVQILHPAHGVVTAKRAAELDVKEHQCHEYLFAVTRARRIIREKDAA